MPLSKEDHGKIEKVVGYLVEARSILFITGAGVSADSGLPTYRGVGGLYDDADTDDGVPVEMAMAGRMLRTNPEITWKHLARIEQAARGKTFNRAHEVIAEVERRFPRVWVLTQNVDGFHRMAGSRNVIDIHGDCRELTCMGCDYRTTVKDYAALEIPPRCPKCGDTVRPDVVLFGELIPPEKVQALQLELARGFDLIFSVGTTSVFPYIAQPVINGRFSGIPTVEINPGLTEVSFVVDVRIAGGAAETLDAIWRRYQEGQPVRHPGRKG